MKYFLSNTKSNKGFTFVETLVVVVIIGILSAIALRSGLQFITRSREVVGRQQVSQVLGLQESHYYFESEFGASFAELDAGNLIENPQTDDYFYEVETDASGQSSIITATPLRPEISGYAGRVFTELNPVTNNVNIFSFVCEGDPGAVPEVAGLRSDAECPDVDGQE